MEQTLVHMLNCSEKLFGAGDSKKSGKPQSESKHSKNTRRSRLKEHETDATGQSDAGKCEEVTNAQPHNAFALYFIE